MKFEDVIFLKRLSDVLKRIFVQGKFFFLGLLIFKLWLEDLDLMFLIFYKIFNLKIIGLVYFVVYIDDVNVVILDEDENVLQVYNICIEKLINIYYCDSKLYGICYVYSLNRIYVVFENFVVQYEIKEWSMEFIEFEKI